MGGRLPFYGRNTVDGDPTIFIFIHHKMVEKRKQKYCNEKEAHKDTYMNYRIRRKSDGKQS